MKIVFLGTPEFALPSLRSLYDAGHEVTVVTQPDKRVGRKQTLEFSPVKRLALELGLPVFQFERIRSEAGVSALKELSPDLMVTVAFGQILSRSILDIPKYGCINVHASLLPKYRGAAPVQQSIADGEKITGVTTMMTDVGLDTGDILLSEEVEIGSDETAGELLERLSILGASVLLKTINSLVDGTLTRTLQNNEKATKCKMLKKEDGRIDFLLSAEEIHNLVRAMNPWPVAFCFLKGAVIKVWRTKRRPDIISTDVPGTVIAANHKAGLLVTTGNGVLEIIELQPQNGKRMEANAFINGQKILGEIFT